MKKIVATINNSVSYLESITFNTDIQYKVEMIMEDLGYGCEDYNLSFKEEEVA